MILIEVAGGFVKTDTWAVDRFHGSNDVILNSNFQQEVAGVGPL